MPRVQRRAGRGRGPLPLPPHAPGLSAPPLLPLRPPRPRPLHASRAPPPHVGLLLNSTHDWGLVFDCAAGVHLLGAAAYLKFASAEDQGFDALAPAPVPAAGSRGCGAPGAAPAELRSRRT